MNKQSNHTKLMFSMLLSLIISSIACNGKNNTHVQWIRTYGGKKNDYVSAVRKVYDGGYIICGTTYSFNSDGYDDVYAVRTDARGDTVWTKTYGSAFYDAGNAMCSTRDSCYVITGLTDCRGAMDGRIYLLKINVLGDTVWTKSFGSSNQINHGHSVQQTIDGGYIVSGVTWLSYDSSYQYILTKTDSLGNTQWVRRYGGVGIEDAFSAQQTSDNGYIIAGLTSSFGQGKQDVYVVKTDSVGNIEWTRTYGGGEDDCALYIHTITGGNCLITGYTYSYKSFHQIFLLCIDSLGEQRWLKLFDYASAGVAVHNERIIMAGITNYENQEAKLHIQQFDHNGDILSSARISDYNFSINQIICSYVDSSIALTGITKNNQGDHDMVLMKVKLYSRK